jgi:hypothetical protein
MVKVPVRLPAAVGVNDKFTIQAIRAGMMAGNGPHEEVPEKSPVVPTAEIVKSLLPVLEMETAWAALVVPTV